MSKYTKIERNIRQGWVFSPDIFKLFSGLILRKVNLFKIIFIQWFRRMIFNFRMFRYLTNLFQPFRKIAWKHLRSFIQTFASITWALLSNVPYPYFFIYCYFFFFLSFHRKKGNKVTKIQGIIAREIIWERDKHWDRTIKE